MSVHLELVRERADQPKNPDRYRVTLPLPPVWSYEDTLTVQKILSLLKDHEFKRSAHLELL